MKEGETPLTVEQIKAFYWFNGIKTGDNVFVCFVFFIKCIQRCSFVV